MNAMTKLVIRSLHLPDELSKLVVEAHPLPGPRFVITLYHTPYDDEICEVFPLHPLFIESTSSVEGINIYMKVPDKLKSTVNELVELYDIMDDDHRELLDLLLSNREASDG
jgi:hypothetical protein